MYNKVQFKKINDKKVLHKVKKHWITISIALLGLLGGGAVTAHTHVAADSTTMPDNQANHQLNTNQLANNRSVLINDQANHSSQYGLNHHVNNYTIQSSSYNGAPNDISKNVTAQANVLHDHIIKNAGLNNYQVIDEDAPEVSGTPATRSNEYSIRIQYIDESTHKVMEPFQPIRFGFRPGIPFGSSTWGPQLGLPAGVFSLKKYIQEIPGGYKFDPTGGPNNNGLYNVPNEFTYQPQLMSIYVVPATNKHKSIINGRIVIHYIDRSTNMQLKTAGQQESDSPAGSPFNLKQHLFNLPNGYQLWKVNDYASDVSARIYSDVNHNIINKTIPVPTKFPKGTDNVFVWVTNGEYPNDLSPAQIYAHYIDQNGLDVTPANERATGQPILNSDDMPALSTPVDISSDNKNPNYNLTVPQGYQLIKNQHYIYNVNIQPQQIILRVKGNQIDKPFTIHRYEEIPGQSSLKLSDKQVDIDNGVGSTIVYQPSDFTPHGFLVDSSNPNNHKILITIKPDETLSPSDTTFYYTDKNAILPMNPDNIHDDPLMASFASVVTNDDSNTISHYETGLDNVANGVNDNYNDISLDSKEVNFDKQNLLANDVNDQSAVSSAIQHVNDEASLANTDKLSISEANSEISNDTIQAISYSTEAELDDSNINLDTSYASNKQNGMANSWISSANVTARNASTVASNDQDVLNDANSVYNSASNLSIYINAINNDASYASSQINTATFDRNSQFSKKFSSNQDRKDKNGSLNSHKIKFNSKSAATRDSILASEKASEVESANYSNVVSDANDDFKSASISVALSASNDILNDQIDAFNHISSGITDIDKGIAIYNSEYNNYEATLSGSSTNDTGLNSEAAAIENNEDNNINDYLLDEQKANSLSQSNKNINTKSSMVYVGSNVNLSSLNSSIDTYENKRAHDLNLPELAFSESSSVNVRKSNYRSALTKIALVNVGGAVSDTEDNGDSLMANANQQMASLSNYVNSVGNLAKSESDRNLLNSYSKTIDTLSNDVSNDINNYNKYNNEYNYDKSMASQTASAANVNKSKAASLRGLALADSSHGVDDIKSAGILMQQGISDMGAADRDANDANSANDLAKSNAKHIFKDISTAKTDQTAVNKLYGEITSVSNHDRSLARSAAKSADDSIANSYHASVSASVSKANQQVASSAAQTADDSIHNSYQDSVSTSVSIANRSLASSAAKSADKSIADSYRASVSASVSKADQQAASSAAQTADDSIRNSYHDSVSASVSIANRNLASSAVKSADDSIANSYRASVSASVSKANSCAASSAAQSSKNRSSSMEESKLSSIARSASNDISRDRRSVNNFSHQFSSNFANLRIQFDPNSHTMLLLNNDEYVMNRVNNDLDNDVLQPTTSTADNADSDVNRAESVVASVNQLMSSASNNQPLDRMESITVVYSNQNGQKFDRNILGRLNQTGEDVTKLGTLPLGYHLNPNQNTNYRFTSNPQMINLGITGNKVYSNLSITIKRFDSNHKLIKSSIKHVNISGLVGNSYMVNPQDYVPSGFKSLNNKPALGTFNCDGITNSSISFNYIKNISQPSSKEATYTVQVPIYINGQQNGTQTVSITGSDGDIIDLTNNMAPNRNDYDKHIVGNVLIQHNQCNVRGRIVYTGKMENCRVSLPVYVNNRADGTQQLVITSRIGMPTKLTDNVAKNRTGCSKHVMGNITVFPNNGYDLSGNASINYISVPMSSSSSNSSLSSASTIIKSDINKINSYDQQVTSYNDIAVNELGRLNLSSNIALNTLRSNDLNEVNYDASAVGKNNSVIGSLNQQINTKSYNYNSLISMANNQVYAADNVAQEASLVAHNDTVAIESIANRKSNSNRASNSSSNGNTSVNSSNDNILSNYNLVNNDESKANDYLSQISQDAKNSNVISDDQASSAVENDFAKASSTVSMIDNDRLNPNEVNLSNANSELDITQLAASNAGQVMTNAIGSSSNHSNSSNSNLDSSASNSNSNGQSSNSNQRINSNSVPSQNSSNNNFIGSNSSDDNNINSNNGNSTNNISSPFNAKYNNNVNHRSNPFNNQTDEENQSNELPQTGQSLQKKLIAEILLALSTGINVGFLGELMDRKRLYD